MNDSLQAHVASVIQNHQDRNCGGTASDLIPMLSARVSMAKNKGLASSVFWHGKWFAHAEAKTMLRYLHHIARQEKRVGSEGPAL
jgi:hypothetical protein